MRVMSVDCLGAVGASPVKWKSGVPPMSSAAKLLAAVTATGISRVLSSSIIFFSRNDFPVP